VHEVRNTFFALSNKFISDFDFGILGARFLYLMFHQSSLTPYRTLLVASYLSIQIQKDLLLIKCHQTDIPLIYRKSDKKEKSEYIATICKA